MLVMAICRTATVTLGEETTFLTHLTAFVNVQMVSVLRQPVICVEVQLSCMRASARPFQCEAASRLWAVSVRKIMGFALYLYLYL